MIEALADGQFHSGESLGRLLGISRAAVWKRLSTLAAKGVVLESVRGKGYRILGGLELLDEGRLNAGSSVPVVVLDETVSTNDDAVQMLRQRSTAFAVLAEHQTAGRGRRGRQWVSPYGCNLMLSFGYRFPVGALRLEGLSLAVGVLVAEALEALGLQSIGLKWPNDIWVGDKKIGGILIELAGDLQDSCAAVIGIGINGKIPLQAAAIDQPWTDYALESGQPLPRNQLASELIERLHQLCKAFPVSGFSVWQEPFNARDVLVGREVIARGTSEMLGIAQGVSETGAFRMLVDGKEVLINGGEISLRPVRRMAGDV